MGRLRVRFRIGANINLVDPSCRQPSNKINGVGIAVGMRHELAGAFWWVTTQRYNARYAGIDIRFCNRQCLGAAGIDTSQMSRDIKSVL